MQSASNGNGERREMPTDGDDSWFDAVRIVDEDWVELDVTTTQGETVRYRIPRRTLFASIDK